MGCELCRGYAQVILMKFFTIMKMKGECQGHSPIWTALNMRWRTDLGFTGDVFTWCNHNHNSDDYIKEKLDWAVANGD